MDRPIRNGFTLIEMLIAMTLLSVIVALLFASLRIAAESWNVGEAKLTEVNQKAVVYQFFRRHLSGIKPVPAPTEDNESSPTGLRTDAPDAANQTAETLAFEGRPHAIRFVAALPSASARKGLQTFTVDTDPDSSSVIRVSLVPYGQLPDTAAEATVLLNNVEDFELAYYGTNAETDKTAWHEQWINAEQLPLLIKVRIVLRDHSFWPDMIFPVRINARPTLTAPPANAESVDDANPN
ncbi:prepilin-type N-terminal cleavage/methylation domain-containing protein [Methylomonas sp. MED-D]|uniref:prepilin-type N-terminal cleavage/methylation domain-containing protein n=1 Tax=unclassified Methylomonas TaxID=2608980 RepID=UPI00247A668D|nr:prepilin-type N-terminal cleavage/methylation domain-containing protein [Methylomonas sp. UP202]WGS84623.1 prepilin-type N-terminal cleavage/methylation domain-containing protein [Methylomonas sp. UP202]